MENNYIEAGGDFIKYLVNPGSLSPTKPASIINNIDLQKENGDEIAAYLLDRYDITSLISIEAGIRHSTFLYRGAHTIYNYQPGVPNRRKLLPTVRFMQKEKLYKAIADGNQGCC